MKLSQDKQIEYSITAIKEIIAETEKESIKIEHDLSHKPTIFESKFAGLGYVPHDKQIPVNSLDTQLRLLAQIDCSKVELENFPEKGLLQFWVIDDDLVGADFDEPTVQDDFQIIYYETVDETVTEEEVAAKVIESEEESDFPIDKEIALKFVKSKESLTFGDYRFEKLFIEKFNKLSPDEQLDDIYNLDFNIFDVPDKSCSEHLSKSGWGHKTGGYPSFTQMDPRNEDDGLDTVLLQIDSCKIDDSHEIIWGDTGICNFFINGEKLKNRDFSDVMYNWDCY